MCFAVPISLLILALFYYWYAVADRYAIFLYGHQAPGIPLTTPFDEVTRSRYWMTGLVAAGGVMVLYALANWLLGRVAAWRGRAYRPPVWWRVWVTAAAPLSLGIPAITMTVNQPTLPAGLAAACAAVTLAGLALALAPGAWAAQRPCELLWLAADGAGLMPTLLLLRAVELPARGVIGAALAYPLALGGTLAGAAWLLVMSGLRARRRRVSPGAGPLLAAGLCLSYLLMPLVHYLVAGPVTVRYISTASNFFAFGPIVQWLVFCTAALLAFWITRLRRGSGGRVFPATSS